MGKKSRAKKERKAFEAIAASMPDLGGAGAHHYDDSGWPAGREGERAARFLMEDWLNRLDAQGWDQKDSVMLVTRPDATAADLAAEGIDVGALGDMLIEEQGQDPSKVIAGALMGTATITIETDPVQGLWGQTAGSEVSAIGLAVETWTSEERTMPPSQDPNRGEMRVLQLLTRSGQQFQMSRERDSDEIQWSMGSGGRFAVLMRQFLGVPIPSSWPRTSMQRYCGYVAADECAKGQRRVARAVGADGVSPRASSGFILGMAMRLLWDMARDGELLPVKDRALLRDALDRMDFWLQDDDDLLDALAEATQRGYASRGWRDFVSSPQVQARTKDTALIPFHEPYDWASDDTIAAYVGVMFSDVAGNPLEEIPKQARKAARDMLHRLGLT